MFFLFRLYLYYLPVAVHKAFLPAKRVTVMRSAELLLIQSFSSCPVMYFIIIQLDCLTNVANKIQKVCEVGKVDYAGDIDR